MKYFILFAAVCGTALGQQQGQDVDVNDACRQNSDCTSKVKKKCCPDVNGILDPDFPVIINPQQCLKGDKCFCRQPLVYKPFIGVEILLCPTPVDPDACRAYPQGVLGTCIPIADCPRLTAALAQAQARSENTNAIHTLRNSVCDPSSIPSKICCENETADPLSPSHGLPNINNCGKGQLGDTIVVGENTESWWPWIVLLYGRRIGSGRTGYFCGGTLITDRFVITAAHCKDPAIAIESVRIGELHTKSDPDTKKGVTAPPVQDIPVTNFVTHPQYKSPCETCNDIAIVKLKYPVTIIYGFSTPICLPSQPELDMKLSISDFPRHVAVTVGWGLANSNPFDDLQEVQLKIETQSVCQLLSAEHPVGSVICAGSMNEEDSYRGDSGGSLMLKGKDASDIRWYLVGVSSFDPTEGGDQETQGIYTSVHHYLEWIQQNIR